MKNLIRGAKVRFAPSLSGDLHLGNMASMLYIIRFTRSERLLWRIDQRLTPKTFVNFNKQRNILNYIDTGRSVVFRILNIDSRYEGYIDRLKEAKLLYFDRKEWGCFRLDLRALNKGLDRVEWTEANGRRVEVSIAKWNDPIAIDSSGRVLYTLGSALWDIENMISIVIRGRDLVPSSVIQILIHRFFNREIPQLHHGLFLKGNKLTKSIETPLSLNSLIRNGITPSSCLRWVEDHSKKLHFKALDISNLSTNDKVVKEDEIYRWLRKDQRNNSWREVRNFLPFRLRGSRSRSLWSLWRLNLVDNNDLRDIVSFDIKEDFLRGIDTRSFLRDLRRIIWCRDNTPDVYSSLKAIPKSLLLRRINQLRDIDGVK